MSITQNLSPDISAFRLLSSALDSEVSKIVEAVEVKYHKYKSGRQYIKPEFVLYECDRCDEPADFEYKLYSPSLEEALNPEDADFYGNPIDHELEAHFTFYRCIYHGTAGRSRGRQGKISISIDGCEQYIIPDSTVRLKHELREDHIVKALVDNIYNYDQVIVFSAYLELMKLSRKIRIDRKKKKKMKKVYLHGPQYSMHEHFKPVTLDFTVPDSLALVPTVKLPVSDIAVSADKRAVISDIAPVVNLTPAADKSLSEVVEKKKKKRGGKRNYAKQPGLCWLKNVPKKHREFGKRIVGYRPMICEVDNFYKHFDIVPRNNKVLFVGNGAHVLRRENWPSKLQWGIITKKDKYRRIGAEDWDQHYEDVIREVFHGDFEHFERFEEWMDYGVDPDEEPAEKPIKMCEKNLLDDDMFIGGISDCWKALFTSGYATSRDMDIIEKFCPVDWDDLPLSGEDFATCVRLMIKDPDRSIRRNIERIAKSPMWLRITKPHIFHLEEVVWSRECPGPEWTAATKLLEMTCNYPCEDGWSNDAEIGAPVVSTLDKAMASLMAPDSRSTTERMLMPIIRDGIDEAIKLCPYKIPAANQHKLEELRITWTSKHTIEHPHPIHASIRRWSYLVAIPKYVNCDCTFVGMKPEHFNMVRRAVDEKHGEGTFKLYNVNPVVDLKDIGRYANTNTVPDEVWDIPKIKTPMLFCDESGHYLSPMWMLKVKELNPNLRCIGMSNIFPLMSLEFSHAPEPTYVNWRVERRKGKEPVLIYIPEEDEGGKYEQPFDPTMTLLKRVETDKGEIVWNGGVVEKKGNLRIQMFYPYAVATPDFLIETEYTMMNIPRLFREQPATVPVPVEWYKKMFDYGCVIPASEDKIMWGKLRTFAEQEKMYLPKGDLMWLVKVVWKAVKICATCSLQSKDYSSVTGEVYYKTIGHIVRLYHKSFQLRYANRNRSLIAHPDPVRVWPTIKVVTSPSADGSVYGLSWEFDSPAPLGFWRHLKLWVESLSQKAFKTNADYDVQYDEYDKVIFPFIHNSYYTRKMMGIRVIKESQRRDYIKVYESALDKVLDPKPLKVRKIRAPKLPDMIPLPPPDPGEEEDLNRSIFDIDDLDALEYMDTPVGSESGESDQTVIASVLDVGKGKYEFETEYRFHPECITFDDAKQMGLPNDITKYEDYCRAILACREIEQNMTLRRVQEGVIERMYFDRKVLTTTQGDHVAASTEARESPRVVSDPDLSEELKKQRELDKEVARDLATVYLPPPKKPLMPTNNFGDYDKRKVTWEKFYKLKSSVASHAHDAVGETLWDLLYPKTVGHRIAAEPYKNIISFPGNIKYPQNDCLLVALAEGLGHTPDLVYFRMLNAWPREELGEPATLPLKVITPVALHNGVTVTVVNKSGALVQRYGVKDSKFIIELQFDGAHVKCLSRRLPLAIGPRSKLTVGTPQQKYLVALLTTHKASNWHEWVPEGKRAADYVRALIAGTTGLLGQPINMDRLQDWMNSCDLNRTPKKFFKAILGEPGSRKSSFVQNILKEERFKQQGVFQVIAPTSVLAQDWRNHLDAPKKNRNGRGMPGTMVTTFEKALADGRTGMVAITDENKFPKGYHALYHIVNPEVQYHIFLCDPFQTSWHEPNSDCLLNDPDIQGEAEYYNKYADSYMIGTYRLPEFNAGFWRMPTFCKRDGGFMFSYTMPTQWQDLKPHMAHIGLTDRTLFTLWETRHEFYAAHFNTVWAEQLRGGEVNSFAGSQGLSVPLCIIEIDEKVLGGTDPRMIYTPMTRSCWILFVIKWSNPNRCEALEDAHPVFKQLAYYRKRYVPGQRLKLNPEHTVSIYDCCPNISRDGMEIVLSGPPEKLRNWDFVKQWHAPDQLERFIDPDEKRAGSRLDYDDEVYEKAYQFWVHIDTHEEYHEVEVNVPEYFPPEPNIPTSIPVEDEEGFIEKHSMLMERYIGELKQRGEYSLQLPDEQQQRKDAVNIMQALVDKEPGPNRRIKRTNVLRRLKAGNPYEDPTKFMPNIYNWGLRQMANDKVSYLAAYQQRIRFASVEENLEQIKTQEEFGHLCWRSLTEYLGWHGEVAFNELQYDKCVEAFQIRRGDRSQALKRMSLNRAEPDFGILMTAKTQWKLKDRVQSAAKPLQPVMVHADEYLFEFGPWGIYLLEKIMEYKPDYWHFHAKKTPEDFGAWVQRWFVGDDMYQMNDQKGQDQAVQGWAVVMFEQLMRYFSIPESVISRFRLDKISKELRGRIMAIMTDSGEVWTYLINTLSSTGRECAMYSLPPGLPMACGGDDIMRRVFGPLSADYLRVQHLDPSIDKRYTSERGDFCSFIVKNGRLAKDPIILLKRFLGKISSGQAEDAVLGYFMLWAFNYNQKDALYDIFDEEELQAQAIMNRIMFNLKKKGIKTKPDWSLITNSRIDGDMHEVQDSFDIFMGVDSTIIDAIENSAHFDISVPSFSTEGQVVYKSVYEAISAMGYE